MLRSDCTSGSEAVDLGLPPTLDRKWSFHQALELRQEEFGQRRSLGRTRSAGRAKSKRVAFKEQRQVKSVDAAQQTDDMNGDDSKAEPEVVKKNSLIPPDPLVGAVTPEPGRRRPTWSFHKTLERQKQYETTGSPRTKKRMETVRGMIRKISQGHGPCSTTEPVPVPPKPEPKKEEQPAESLSPPSKEISLLMARRERVLSSNEEGIDHSAVIVERRRCATMSHLDKHHRKRRTWHRHLTLPKSPLSRRKSNDTKTEFTEIDSPRSRCSTECSSPLTPVQLTARMTVLVVGINNTGKTTLVDLLRERQTIYSEPGLVYSELEYVEVDSDKDDLWQSLSATAFIVVFSTGSVVSRDSAASLVAILRTRRYSSKKPIMLVANHWTKTSSDVSLKKIKYTAKRCQTPFFELSTALPESLGALEVCLYGALYDCSTEGGLSPSPTDGKSSSAKLNPFFRSCLRRGSRSCEDLLILRDRISEKSNK